MAAPILYSSTDAGARVMAITPAGNNTVTDILTECLVGTNGIAYGTKESAGWTLEYSVGRKRVYRNNSSIPGSSGFRLYVEEGDATCIIYAAKTMPNPEDISTFTDRVGPKYFHKLAAHAWYIIADGLTFWMGWRDTQNANYMYAGDYETFIPSNSWNYAIGGMTTNPTRGSTASWDGTSPTAQGVLTPRDIDLNALTTHAVPMSSRSGGTSFGILPAWPLDTKLYTIPYLIYTDKGIIGKLRGGIMPLGYVAAPHDIGALKSNLISPGDQSMILNTRTTSNSIRVISLVYLGDWDAL